MKQITYQGQQYTYDETTLQLYRADGTEVTDSLESIHIVSEWERRQPAPGIENWELVIKARQAR